ncbi:MAG: xylulokinase [Acidobacteriota bacterium]
MPLVIGIDLGTQSAKAVVCDERLAVLGAHHEPIATRFPQPGWAEQDPGEWLVVLRKAIALALHAAQARGEDIAALALAGQLDGCVAVDTRGHPAHAPLIWQDRRATAQLAAIDPARVHAITGQVADPSHMAAKIRWLRDHGVRAARYHQPVSFLVEHLTGAAVLDPSHASTTMLYDLAAGTWSSELLAAFAIDPGELPEIRPTCAIAGTLRAPVASLPAGTPVAVGTGDDFATPLGAGVAVPGPIVVAIGTAEVVGALAASPVLDVPAARGASDPWRALAEPMVETHAYPTGAWFVENPGWLSGGAIRWAMQLLNVASEAELDALAASAPAGAGGVTFVPALAGAMTPVWRPDALGVLDGLTAAHDRAHVARAILEGLAFACRDVVGRISALGLPAREVLVLGGGSRSATWAQLRADALGLPHQVAARADTCAIGAAMIAAVAAGLVPDLAAACALAPPPAATYQPRGSLADAYDRYRGVVARRLQV